MADHVGAQDFAQEVNHLRREYEQVRDCSNLYAPGGPAEQSLKFIDGIKCLTHWYNDGHCIRIRDIPGTLSGDILRLHKNLPHHSSSYEVIGNDIIALEHIPTPPPELEDDSEDLSEVLKLLPIISETDEKKQFLKVGKYRSEIKNLLKCQGGSCPGKPISPHIVHLLGRSPDGRLVFERLVQGYITQLFDSIEIYKHWILELVAGLTALHSLGIIHCDLKLSNLMFGSVDGSRLVICDIEGRWGTPLAPELSPDILDSGFTEKTDIYNLGFLIKQLVYGNNPRTVFVEWPVPQPFQRIADMCMSQNPEDRPSLDALKEMVENIQVGGP